MTTDAVTTGAAGTGTSTFTGTLEDLSHSELVALVQALRAQVEVLQQEVERLRSQLPGAKPPDFVKPDRPQKPGSEDKKPRHKRAQQFVRPKEAPTQVQVHALERCPDCDQRLSGGWVHRRRQVIEIAPPPPVSIIEHVLVARHCGRCHKRCLPDLDLAAQVVGKSRVGVRLMSLIAYLNTLGRLPLRSLQRLLKLLFGLHLSVGELSQVLHTVAAQAKSEQAQLLRQVRASPFVNADETGWREDGQNGYLWTFVTPTIRYFVYNKSRGGQVPVEVLGEDFTGVTVSDFYSGYNGLLGEHQRCWVHLLRDLHALCQVHPPARVWVEQVRQVYERAQSWVPPPWGAERRSEEAPSRFAGWSALVRARHQARLGFEQALLALAQPLMNEPEAPERVLAQRLVRFVKELFVFVERPEVPSHNNAAERALRPCVIARKISGGTRSAQGSATKATLLSLFGTWQAQGKEPWQACHEMLSQHA